MKRTVFAAFMAVISVFASRAQQKGSVEIGFNAGPNFSNVSNYYDGADFSLGFNAGASADFYFNNTWSLKVKAAYDRKGWDNGYITDSYTGYSERTDFNLDYITVPVMAGIHFGPRRNFYANVGPYVGFLVNAKDTRYGADVKSEFNNTDFGLDVAIGFKFPITNYIKFFVELENQTGVLEIYKNTDEYYYDDYYYDDVVNTTTNNRFSINFGINFLL